MYLARKRVLKRLFMRARWWMLPNTPLIHVCYSLRSKLLLKVQSWPNAGIDKVGVIKSTFGADFYYGPGTRSGYNSRTGEFVSKFCYDIQVVFGDKGSNLTFRNIVNGNVTSTAVIKFDERWSGILCVYNLSRTRMWNVIKNGRPFWPFRFIVLKLFKTIWCVAAR